MTDAERRRDERDAERLAKVKPTWQVYSRAIGDEQPAWYQIIPWSEDALRTLCISGEEHFRVVGRQGKIDVVWKPDIAAIHPPTDDPRMETAYKLREPPTVTRAEAAKMVGGDWSVETVHEIPGGARCWQGVLLNTPPSTQISERVVAIRSPGDNVYEIKEG